MQVETTQISSVPSYVAVRRFAGALAQFPGASSVDVRYRPYQLDPHAPPAAGRLLPLLEAQLDPRLQRLVHYVRAIVTNLAWDEGIEIAWGRASCASTPPAPTGCSPWPGWSTGLPCSAGWPSGSSRRTSHAVPTSPITDC